MIQGTERFDSVLQQLIDQTVIIIQALFIDRSRPLRENSGPGYREPVGAQPQLFHISDIFFIAVVAVTGSIPVVAVTDLAWRMRIRIPD
ncbi:hypothetical protein D3C73_1453740 [compost metagenome]